MQILLIVLEVVVGLIAAGLLIVLLMALMKPKPASPAKRSTGGTNTFTDSPTPLSSMPSQATDTQPAFAGEGGSFGGAGADAAWTPDAAAQATDAAPSSDSSSSGDSGGGDSGSSDGGGGGGD